MKVKAITKYVHKGVEYDSLIAIQNHLHNIIGEELMDKIQRICPLEKHKDYFKLLELICTPEIRKILTECLNVTFEDEDGEGCTCITNILDVK